VETNHDFLPFFIVSLAVNELNHFTGVLVHNQLGDGLLDLLAQELFLLGQWRILIQF